MAVTVHQLDPTMPPHRLLSPLLATRIEEFAAKHDEHADAGTLARGTMVRWWSQDPTLALFVALTDAYAIVGHALVSLQNHGKPTAMVIQFKGDPGVEDGMLTTARRIEAWARGQGAVAINTIVQRNPDAFERKYGFKISRWILTKPLNGAPSGPAA